MSDIPNVEVEVRNPIGAWGLVCVNKQGAWMQKGDKSFCETVYASELRRTGQIFVGLFDPEGACVKFNSLQVVSK